MDGCDGAFAGHRPFPAELTRKRLGTAAKAPFGVEGSVRGQPMTAMLRREERHFPLVETGFRWVREGPVR